MARFPGRTSQAWRKSVCSGWRCRRPMAAPRSGSSTPPGARGNRQGLLCHGHGGAGRSRRPDPHHRDLRAGGDQAAPAAFGLHGRLYSDRRKSPRAAMSRPWRCWAKSASRPASSRPTRRRRSSGACCLRSARATVFRSEEIAKGCYVTAMAVLGEVGVQTRIIATYAPEAIKRRLLPSVCTGDCILAICMTEPQAGTDVASYATNTTVRGDTLRLKGVKTLVSRAEEAGAFVVFTRVNGRPGRDGIGCVLVEKGTHGLVLAGKFHTMGGDYLQEVRFEDCELPAENLLLSEGGFKKFLSAFNTQRCLNPSISLGLAEGAFDEALRYARERVAFGRPIGEFQGMRWKLATMYHDIEAGRGLLYRACATADPFPDPLLAATAKVYCN